MSEVADELLCQAYYTTLPVYMLVNVIPSGTAKYAVFTCRVNPEN